MKHVWQFMQLLQIIWKNMGEGKYDIHKEQFCYVSNLVYIRIRGYRRLVRSKKYIASSLFGY